MNYNGYSPQPPYGAAAGPQQPYGGAPNNAQSPFAYHSQVQDPQLQQAFAYSGQGQQDPYDTRKPQQVKTVDWGTWIKQLLNSREFLILWLTPSACFFATILIWTYTFLECQTFCWFWSAIILGLALVLCLPAMRRLSPLSLPIGISLIPAIILASLLGAYLFDSYAIFPKFYQNSRTYENVVPTEPSAAKSDAGKIVFTGETRADAESGISYVAENGNTYCVAPVTDAQSVVDVQYWAAGVNCCTEAGNFNCDSSGDASAHSGIVIFDNHGWFETSRFKYYELARKKAEAQFGTPSVPNPMYVRWVQESNLNKLQNDYALKAFLGWFFFSLFYLVLAAYLAVNMFQFTSKFQAF